MLVERVNPVENVNGTSYALAAVNAAVPSVPPAPDEVIAAPAPIATVDGVIASNVSVIAGVVVAVATEPETPLAVVTETLVTVPVPPPLGAAIIPHVPLWHE